MPTCVSCATHNNIIVATQREYLRNRAVQHEKPKYFESLSHDECWHFHNRSLVVPRSLFSYIFRSTYSVYCCVTYTISRLSLNTGLIRFLLFFISNPRVSLILSPTLNIVYCDARNRVIYTFYSRTTEQTCSNAITYIFGEFRKTRRFMRESLGCTTKMSTHDRARNCSLKSIKMLLRRLNVGLHRFIEIFVDEHTRQA